MGKRQHPKIYSKNQILKIKETGQIVNEVLSLMASQCEVGMSTHQLDLLGKRLIEFKHASSASFGYKGFPGYSCISVDEVIIHGVPSKDKIISEGMIVNIDCPVKYKGMFADAALNVEVGEVDEEKHKLNQTTFNCLMETLNMVGPGVKIGEICKFQEDFAHRHGYKVVKTFQGHGVGRNLHEPPQIPYFFNEKNPYNDYKLKVGNVIAIEPTLVTNDELVTLSDGWGIVNSDLSFGTSWEHTVVITDNGMDILTKQHK